MPVREGRNLASHPGTARFTPGWRAVLLAVSALAGTTTAFGAPPGAARSHAVDRHVEWAQRDSAFATAPVTVIIEADPTALPQAAITAAGGKSRFRFGRLHEVTVPAGKLAALLPQLPASALVRFPYPHQPVAVTGQGVALSGAGDMQALGHAGNGVTIGIIDVGFANLASSQANGDLPANISATDYTGTGLGGSDHGTNVAEIVREMAPGATLRLAKIATETQLNQAVNDMRAAGVKVINHSVVWFNAGFYDGTGPICDIADSAGAAGVHWVNAMGNHRYKHYLGTFTDANGDLRHEFAAGQNHNTISLTAGSRVDLFLNWEAYPQTTIDYDLYLYNGNPDSGGAVVASSTNKQSGKGPAWYPYPEETITYTPGTSGTYYIVARKVSSATTNVRLTLFSGGPDLTTRTTTSSLLQPADCANVIGAGATDLSDNAEYFSSEGPTNDGRTKPEVAGPNRVQTSLTSQFAGTSAAAPHVAGAVAALISQNPGASQVQIRALLTGTAKDVHTAGVDQRTGSGRISLDADSDGRNHDSDNCDLVANADQLNTDGDNQGNACDSDDDNDGLSDTLEVAIGANPLLTDTDGDGLSDYSEVAYGGNAGAYTPGVDLNPLSADTDGDGLGDGVDVLPLAYHYRDGDVTGDGSVDIADYAAAQKFALGTQAATTTALTHGDLYPPTVPDGKIDLSDLTLLLGRVR